MSNVAVFLVGATGGLLFAFGLTGVKARRLRHRGRVVPTRKVIEYSLYIWLLGTAVLAGGFFAPSVGWGIAILGGELLLIAMAAVIVTVRRRRQRRRRNA